MKIWLQISSGRGPEECCWVVMKLSQIVLAEAEQVKLKASCLSANASKHGLFSTLLAIEGANASKFLDSWRGSILWRGTSPFRPNHKRKNWFVSVEGYEQVESFSFELSELRFEALGASGPGGQHANRNQSGIRITHIPSGVSSQALEERSQKMNKALALARMESLFHQKNQDSREQAEKGRWMQHNTLERGNPVRVFNEKDLKA